MMKNEYETIRVFKTALATAIKSIWAENKSKSSADTWCKHVIRPYPIASKVVNYIKDNLRNFSILKNIWM